MTTLDAPARVVTVGAVAVVIAHVAHLSRVLEVVAEDGTVLYSEVMLPTWQNDRWFLPTLEVIRRRWALMDEFGILEREEA